MKNDTIRLEHTSEGIEVSPVDCCLTPGSPTSTIDVPRVVFFKQEVIEAAPLYLDLVELDKDAHLSNDFSEKLLLRVREQENFLDMELSEDEEDDEDLHGDDTTTTEFTEPLGLHFLMDTTWCSFSEHEEESSEYFLEGGPLPSPSTDATLHV
jgi:hypothetical protein